MRERAGPWRRSSRCDTQTCVEVRSDGERVFIRDSARPDGPVLSVSTAGWRAFRRALLADALNR